MISQQAPMNIYIYIYIDGWAEEPRISAKRLKTTYFTRSFFSWNFVVTHRDTHSIHRRTQTHTDTHRHKQIHTDTHRHTQTHTDTHRPTQTHTDTHRHTNYTHTHSEKWITWTKRKFLLGKSYRCKIIILLNQTFYFNTENLMLIVFLVNSK